VGPQKEAAAKMKRKQRAKRERAAKRARERAASAKASRQLERVKRVEEREARRTVRTAVQYSSTWRGCTVLGEGRQGGGMFRVWLLGVLTLDGDGGG